jgi:hypothetical protein
MVISKPVNPVDLTDIFCRIDSNAAQLYIGAHIS